LRIVNSCCLKVTDMRLILGDNGLIKIKTPMRKHRIRVKKDAHIDVPRD